MTTPKKPDPACPTCKGKGYVWRGFRLNCTCEPAKKPVPQRVRLIRISHDDDPVRDDTFGVHDNDPDYGKAEWEP